MQKLENELKEVKIVGDDIASAHYVWWLENLETAGPSDAPFPYNEKKQRIKLLPRFIQMLFSFKFRQVRKTSKKITAPERIRDTNITAAFQDSISSFYASFEFRYNEIRHKVEHVIHSAYIA